MTDRARPHLPMARFDHEVTQVWRMKFSACDRFVRSDSLVVRLSGKYQWIRSCSVGRFEERTRPDG